MTQQEVPHDRVRLTRRRANLWLLLTIPLALVISWFMLVITTLSWCGVSGCSGGGFGRVSDPSAGFAITASLLAGVMWFGALGTVPWLEPRRARLIIAVLVGISVCALVLVTGTAWFVHD